MLDQVDRTTLDEDEMFLVQFPPGRFTFLPHNHVSPSDQNLELERNQGYRAQAGRGKGKGREPEWEWEDPSILEELGDPAGVAAALDKGKGRETTTDEEPKVDGRIGDLLIHESGRISMRIGNLLFDVAAGSHPEFHQDVVALNPTPPRWIPHTEEMTREEMSFRKEMRNGAYVLGEANRKLVVTPNVDAMLAAVNEEAAQRLLEQEKAEEAQRLKEEGAKMAEMLKKGSKRRKGVKKSVAKKKK